MENSLQIAKMLNVYLLYNPAIPLYNLPQRNTNICPCKDLYMNIDRYLVVIIMAPHSSTLAWKIPWTEEPGRLQSMGSRRVGHDWATSLALFTCMHWRRKCNPLQYSCLENPRDRVGCRVWGRTELDMTEAT